MKHGKCAGVQADSEDDQIAQSKFDRPHQQLSNFEEI
jgi:hypothetical protein